MRQLVITKCDSLIYYKVRQLVITKCDSYFITKYDKCYYKVRQVLQSATVLLQSATGITKCDGYYKVRQNKAFSAFSSPLLATFSLFFCLPFSATYCPFSSRSSIRQIWMTPRVKGILVFFSDITICSVVAVQCSYR